ncbi:Gfo/Idh/MocA family oxidoreductase [Sphingobacterium pedocola]|uniref:Oxidoreductase n=1 Tax=Sphingobacterium pedocola TaxID=2082722 RepID=A0ABR9TE01_9SPHI|nr:Gfo/Idh/MocA family oxidoreductase [Sphingobacterium pedocola]MBE8723099.1 oxidoreductase [Sphingobacterium pedocola]
MVIQPIITGILSYGMSGRVFHAPFIENSNYFKFKAVVERSKKNAQLDYPYVISYDSIDELLSDSEIELVIVNTPNDTHFDFAKRALLSGKHVLIEKPFSPTVAEAKELFEIGKQTDRCVLPFHNRRFDSDFKSLKYILDKNLVGKPIELHLRFDRFKPEIGPKIFKETPRPASGVLYDLGSHLLDQVISLFGNPKSATKILSQNRPNTKVDDYASLILNYQDGLNVFITTSLLVANPQKSFVLHGANGTFIKDRTDVQEAQLQFGMSPLDPSYGLEHEGQDGLLTVILDDVTEEIDVSPEKGDYMQLFDAVYQTIRLREPYFVTAEQILCQLEILAPAKKK